MTKELAWLENFTGIPLAEGAPTDERIAALKKTQEELAGREQAYEIKRQKQALLLAEIRAELNPIKAKSQKLLSTPIPSGPLKGKSFLNIDGDQIKEIDPETLSTLFNGKKKLAITDVLPGSLGPEILQVKIDLDKLGARLSAAQYEVNGKSVDLFEETDVIAEYWAPLRLERIYPDGLVDDKFSETQRMLNATNQLYLDMCEQKKIAGQLTPEIDLFSEVLETGKDLVGIGAESLGAFAKGSEQAKLAKSILESVGTALGTSNDIYKQLKDSDYAGAAAGGLDLAGKLTGALVGKFVSPEAGKATEAGFAVGTEAVLMGKALAQYRSGDGTLQEALDVMGELVGKSLTLAADQTGGATSEGLRKAAKIAPSALRAAGLASGPLVKAVRAGDFPSVVKALGEITKEVLGNLPGLDSKENQELLNGSIDLATAGTGMIYKMAVSARKGKLQDAFATAIADIGANLGAVLKLAGVPADIAKTVVGAYTGSVSAGRAVQMLVKDPGNVAGAIQELSGGLDKALGGSGDPLLAKIGEGIKASVDSLVAAKEIADLYKAGECDPALDKLIADLGSGVKTIVTLSVPKGEDDEEEDDDEDEDEDEEEDDTEGDVSGEGEAPQPRKLKREQRKAVAQSLAEMIEEIKAGTRKVDPAQIKEAVKKMDEDRDAQEAQAANEEALLLLAEAELDLKALSDAERTGAEASNIDKLIADLLRDRMILKIATQIAQGGAEFLAQFVPALGAVSAGIKLAANLVAAAQRAQQLDSWIKAQQDLSAAQSALSSSAANFVKNQGQQLAHYSMQAFFAATQLAGKITELAGPAAPVGTIIAAVAGASAKAEQMLMDRADKVQIEKAWKVTYKSLRNPRNRQLGLKARELNPSLAKFSIAWGAVVLKDPLARDAMRACGLNEASLKNDNTDVNKVVKYLEVFYEDDKSLYRDSTDPVPEWIPADAEVTLKWWSQLRLAASTSAKLQVKNGGLLEGLLGELMAVEEEANASADAVTHERDLFISLRTVMETAIATMVATTPGQEPPALLPPSTEDLETAIDAHHDVVVRQYGLLTQIAEGYMSCTVEPDAPAKPGTEDPNIKELGAVLKQLTAHAGDAAKVAKAEAQGLETSKLALKTMTEQLRGKAEARAKSLEKETAPV